MASFNQKLTDFLNAAHSKDIIDSDTTDRLVTFAKSGDYEHKGWLNLSAAILGIAGFTLVLGIILLVASNWHYISDNIKIFGFLVLLAGMHAGGFFLHNKGYNNTASSLHFVGAGLFIAGIGLIAQIFNLHSASGVSFLIWSIMVLPLAFLLRNGPILLMAVFAFCIWQTIQITRVMDVDNEFALLMAFFIYVGFTSVLIGQKLLSIKSNLSNYLIVPGFCCLIVLLYITGFFHHTNPDGEKSNDVLWFIVISNVFLFLVLYLGSPILALYKQKRFLFVGLCFAYAVFVGLVALCHDAISSSDLRFSFESFGYTRTIYILPLIISLLSYAAYFLIAFWFVIHGALTHKRWLMNIGIIIIGVGLYTRFLDLFGSMEHLGITFVTGGVMLLLIGFFLERWRRRLIANA